MIQDQTPGFMHAYIALIQSNMNLIITVVHDGWEQTLQKFTSRGKLTVMLLPGNDCENGPTGRKE